MVSFSPAIAGFTRADAMMSTSASRIASAGAVGNVDIAKEVGNMVSARVQTAASAKVVRSASDTIGQLLDIVA